jgi:RNA polymerase sigma-70 factor (sigma-E family)
MRRLAYLLCGDEHRADDLVQQAITRLYVNWNRVHLVNHLDRYVRQILVRVFLDERRLAWARVRLFREPPEPPPLPAVDIESRQVLRAALAQLPRGQQTVLVLRFLIDLPVDEVAATLGVTPGTVKSQTAHGLATLRRVLSASDGSDTTAPASAARSNR